MYVEPCVMKHLKPKQSSMGRNYLNVLITFFLNQIHLSIMLEKVGREKKAFILV